MCFLESKCYRSIKRSPQYTLLLANCLINFEVLTAVSLSPFHQILQSSLSTIISVSLYQNCKFYLISHNNLKFAASVEPDLTEFL